MSDSTSYTARWLLTAAGLPIENGILVVKDGKVEAIESAGSRKVDVDFGNAALMPGLVNAHTHLDLSGARGLIPPTDPEHFTDWLKGVIAYRRTRSPEQVQEDIRDGLAECLKAGTTLIGDIASGGASWDICSSASIRCIIFHEFIGISFERSKESYFALLKWDKNLSSPLLCRSAVSPHAPYSVNPAFFRSLSWNGWSMAIHTAESSSEVELISSRTGPFKSFLEDLGIWQPGNLLESFDWLLWRTRRATSPKLFIHCNYLSIESVFCPHQSIVYCPRTHAAFGHPPHPFREFMKRGVRVCLGTDSLASNPDLDILAEARFVKERYPDFDGETLLKMVSRFGAEALGWADECGSLEPGKSADAVAVPLPDCDGDPYDLLFNHSLPGDRKVLFRGDNR